VEPRAVADAVERLQTALADRYRIERELGRGGAMKIVAFVSGPT
jgi:hypothetical protein